MLLWEGMWDDMEDTGRSWIEGSGWLHVGSLGLTLNHWNTVKHPLGWEGCRNFWIKLELFVSFICQTDSLSSTWISFLITVIVDRINGPLDIPRNSPVQSRVAGNLSTLKSKGCALWMIQYFKGLWMKGESSLKSSFKTQHVPSKSPT